MVDFLTGHRLGTDISSEYRLTGQVLLPNSKNSSIMYETWPCPTTSGLDLVQKEPVVFWLIPLGPLQPSLSIYTFFNARRACARGLW